jgi:hypothetical protein
MRRARILCVVVCFLCTAGPAFAQAAAPAGPQAAVDAPNLSEEGRIVGEVQKLYAAAGYEACRALIRSALERVDAGELHFPDFYLAQVRVYQALLAYAFRETGFEKEVEGFLLQAVALDLNYDFTDYTLIPTYVLEQFVRIRRDYLARFSKTTRRHSVGLYAMTSNLPQFFETRQFLNLGLHYSLNLSEFFSLLVDTEVPLSEDLFSLLQFRTGAVWFPSFKVETMSLGLGLLYSLKVEDWKAFTHVLTFEGYGEFIFRFGLGVGASVELLRFDLLLGSGSFTELGSVPFFSGDKVRFSFANLRFYVFWTF